MVSLDEAIRILRNDPSHTDLIRDAYLDRDVDAAAERFAASAEFAQVKAFLRPHLSGSTIIDLGAGSGVAARAFAMSGARLVCATEPDPSDEVGRGAMLRMTNRPDNFVALAGAGEHLPFENESVDIVYMRQVLHHTSAPDVVLRECKRVLRRDGLVLDTREHVADDEEERARFLAEHPVNRLAGGENAYPLATYLDAFSNAGFREIQAWGPWDTIVNAFPVVRDPAELERYPRRVLSQRFGAIGSLIAAVPGVSGPLWRIVNRPDPGRLYSFLAVA